MIPRSVVLGIDLDEMRHIGDPSADAMAATFAADLAEPHKLMESLRKCFDPQASDPPACIREWIGEDDALPEWADPAMIRAGQAVFQRWALQIFAALFCASLPAAYAARNGARLLSGTSDLARGGKVGLRLVETTIMLIDVHEPVDEAFTPQSQAWVTLRGVRATHAGIRHLIGLSGAWDEHALDALVERGKPINQEDLLGTQLSFTTVVFDALHRLGVKLTEQEKAAYLHLWAVIGHQLGIVNARAIITLPEAHAMQAAIIERQHEGSPEGKELMKALLAEAERAMPRGLRKVPRTLVRRAAGPQVCDLLEVPTAAWWGWMLVPFAMFGRRVTRIPGIRRLSGWPMGLLGSAFLRRFWNEALTHQSPRFRMTKAQATRWRVRRLDTRAVVAGPADRADSVRTMGG